MFRNWGFLLGEMWVLLILAALLGLLAGWLIWGRRSEVTIDTSEADRLRDELNACKKKNADCDAQVARLEAELKDRSSAVAQPVDTGEVDRLRSDLEACRKRSADYQAEINRLKGELNAKSASAGSVTTAAVAAASSAGVASAAVETPPASADMSEDYDGDGVLEGKNEGTKPATLDGPRNGQADDLKQIKGIGPKLEQLCNKLGFYHFDQVAAWTADEVAWVDANLEGFKGRVSRDNWVEQAKVLAQGGETEFSQRVKDGDVY